MGQELGFTLRVGCFIPAFQIQPPDTKHSRNYYPYPWDSLGSSFFFLFVYHATHTATTAPTNIPNNDTKIVGMPITTASLGPPGPVVTLAVAVEHENAIDTCYVL